ncbi:SET and MYND domain-containing protein 4-like isoform X2 [Phymastichus coffea]|nr:SET and MYND domain-containing protein 4-like isoform X2 [Phymastichus coffea]XP_058803856.1 SET and MYND domain-containing protein 4-like isoform X2 [Phymastichus coffea]XP_058803865.1 SET and MYND domain-containing protein 4-like isoform X2 [Phymastichus coffea]XP_058803874.1 SET and MYND domain-containing protein 4-like isoform X2 [Phymastichus coffea]XP_058803884.1 SET and MYND domain-containing protein 4-like isoform X2 [Phymastichus coffea]
MASWQYLLQSILQEHKNFVLKNKDRNEFELMKFFVDNDGIRKQINLWFYNVQHSGISYEKNMQKSEQFRKLGNREFKNKTYLDSIKYYTLSLQYASWESQEFALALANRSAALFHLEKYQACTEDIKLAMEYNYPQNMLYKLYLRAARCYLKLQKKNLVEEFLCKLNECLETDYIISSNKRDILEKQILLLSSEAINIVDIIEMNELDCHLPEIAFGEHSEFRNASAALNLKFSKDKGRHVYANQNIKKGQILFVERPFAFVLLENEFSHTVCAQCCKWKGDVPISCKFCANTIYCTEKCRIDAWLTHHQWECFGNQIDIWNKIGIAHLTIRTFLTCCYTEDKIMFNNIQRLVTNINEISTQDMFIYGITALMMTLYLHDFTNFFEVMNIYEVLFAKFDDSKLNMHTLLELLPEDWSKHLTLVYISGIILRHMLQLICNGHAITKLQLANNENGNCITEYQCRLATAIYPSASMMNHSCDPNIINSFKDKYLIVKAIKDIPIGSEIFNCYGPHYRRMYTKDRQVALQSQYCFKCECDACTLRPLNNFLYKFQTLSCEDCMGPLELINNSSAHCLDCQTTIYLKTNLIYELEESKNLHNKAKIDLEERQFEQALEKAKRCLDIRKKFLNQSHEAVASTYDLIGKILALMGRWLDSISHLEHSIAAVEERFGEHSIELANEINKITDICMQYLNEETNTNTKQYKNTAKKTRRLLNRAEEIFNLNYGPWNDADCQITNKLQDLVPLLENLNL